MGCRLRGGLVKRGRLRDPPAGLARLSAGARRLRGGARRRRPARGLPHLGGHGDGQARDLFDGLFDVRGAGPAREGVDHGFDGEQEDDAGSVDGSQLGVTADHRPRDAADGRQALDDLVPAATQHVGLTPVRGVGDGCLSALGLLGLRGHGGTGRCCFAGALGVVTRVGLRGSSALR